MKKPLDLLTKQRRIPIFFIHTVRCINSLVLWTIISLIFKFPLSATPVSNEFRQELLYGPPPSRTIKQLIQNPHPAQEEVELCRDCHPQYVEGFQKTHMSNAMSRPLLSKVIENFDPQKSTIIHPKTKIGYRAYIDDLGEWWQEEFDPNGTYTRAVKVKYLIGSGHHTRSYIAEVNGELIELPLTWYSPTKDRNGLWDMSPGYDVKDHFRFERPVKGDCLFCHNDLGKIDQTKLSGFVEDLPSGITCQRCHGKGTTHIESRYAGNEPPVGQADPTIYNPKYETITRQHQICEQCHLSGEARALLPGQTWDKYDPRTPLEDFVRIYAFPVKREKSEKGSTSEQFGIASHVERMKLSECAKQSSSFTCTTCHNPHQPDHQREYQNACLNCHSSNRHTSEASKLTCSSTHQDSSKLCFECHMKKGETSDIPHVRMTDHWIRKNLDQHNNQKHNTLDSELKSLLPPLKKELQSYEDGLLGLAYADLVRFNQRSDLAEKALQLLVKAAQIHPTWSEVWGNLGEVSTLLGDQIAALAAYQKHRELKPKEEFYRLKESALLTMLGKDHLAEDILTQLIESGSKNYRVFEQLASLKLKQQNAEAADRLYQQASELAPHAYSPLHNRGFLALIQGKLKKALEYFELGIQRDGINREGPFYKGLLFAAQKNYPTAERFMNEALRRDIYFDLAYQQLARIQYEQNKINESLKTINNWIKQRPKSAEARFWLVQYLDAQARYSEAYQVLLQANQELDDPRFKKALKIALERLKLQDGLP